MAEAVWVLGIEIGGTKLQLGIGRGQGDLVVLERLTVEPSRHAAGILDQIRYAFPILLRNANLDRTQIQAVGIGFGGPVDTKQGVVRKVLPDCRLGRFPAGRLDPRASGGPSGRRA